MAKKVKDNYSLAIKGKKPDEEGYVVLANEEIYQITLCNRTASSCLAAIDIDGKRVGVYKIESCRKRTIKGPKNSTQRFVFRSSKSNTDVSPEKGVVSATFCPELPFNEVQVYRGYSSGSTEFCPNSEEDIQIDIAKGEIYQFRLVGIEALTTPSKPRGPKMIQKAPPPVD